MLEVDGFVEEHRHEVLYSAYYFPIQLKFSGCQKNKYYNSNIGRNCFGMDAVATV
jgi:hypothetical protein